MRIVKLNAETKKDLLKNLLKRSPSNFGNYAETVQGIVDDVRDNGEPHSSHTQRSSTRQI